jgi:chromate transporter
VNGEAPTPAASHHAAPAISCRDLVLTFLKLGSIGFGGGMAMIAMMEHEFVGKRQLMKSEEFLHGVGLGQLLGPFATNTAFFIGYRLHGLLGGVLSGTALMFPSLAAAIILSWLYFAFEALPGMQSVVGGLGPVVIALILNAAWSMARKALHSWPAMFLSALALAAGVYRVNPVAVLFMAGAFGLAVGKRRLNGASRQAQAAGNPATVAASPAASEAAAPEENITPRSGMAFTLVAAQGLSAAGAVSLWQLAVVFFKVGCVFFGGGFVLIPVLHRTLVLNLHWLNAQQFIDGIAISNLTPGPMAVLATFAGYRLLGLAGALVATVALFLPGTGLTFILTHQYERMKGGARAQDFLAGVVPAVIGLILSAGVLLSKQTLLSWQDCLMSGACLLLMIRWRVPPVFVLVLGALAGAIGIR